MTKAAVNEFGPRLVIPYLAGTYLAVNAISDAYLVVDGPMCSHYKIEQIQGNHDIRTELAPLAMPPRIVQTGLQDDKAVIGDEELLTSSLMDIDKLGDAGAILVTGTSCSLLIGRDIERMISESAKEISCPVIPVRSNTLAGDWLDGWESVSSSLAKTVPLASRKKSKKPTVGIVGYPYTRHEGDTAGDLVELHRMVEALGAELVSVWFDGRDVASLSEIGRADLIVSLPYARRAAKTLAKRSGARLINVPLPLSFSQSETFLRKIADELDAADAAESFITKEKAAYAEPILFLAEQHLVGQRWMLVADPYAAQGWIDIAADVGADIIQLIYPCKDRPVDALPDSPIPGNTLSPVFGTDPAWDSKLVWPMRTGDAELLIGNGLVIRFAGKIDFPFFEYGYPSYTHHPILPTPTLGFAGQAAIIQRMGELFSLREHMKAR